MQSKLSFLVINAPCLYITAALNCIDPLNVSSGGGMVGTGRKKPLINDWNCAKPEIVTDFAGSCISGRG
jgi:hypothetical protein